MKTKFGDLFILKIHCKIGALKLSVTLFADVQKITHSEIKSTSNICTTCKCP